ncbi:hypothetical protein ABZU25_20540 [Micromonospora sp. NPDC005215]|uniref:hypothetical protein n=1 Tax=Micromonospora sp. NPDC005215 TaxID=3157024 RepID=UPI0033B87FCB
MSARPHHPGHPHWRCTTCGAHWPCSPARLSLLWRWERDFDGLAMLLSQHAVAALTDAFRLGLDPQPAAYAERFLGWVLDRARKDVEKNG